MIYSFRKLNISFPKTASDFIVKPKTKGACRGKAKHRILFPFGLCRKEFLILPHTNLKKGGK